MRELECPTCKEPLIVAEHGGVEIDTCAVCGGVWLDGGELEALIGATVPELIEPDAGLGEPTRDCPVCVDKLVKDRYGHTDIVVDKCPHGDGIWLDPGELEAILAAFRDQPPAGGVDERAAGALTDFFGDRRPRETEPEGESAE
ncbi:MAG: zf-TFIIB domain-containing protein [Planctomycetota bacterium]